MNKHEGEGSCQHDTATSEAMHRLSLTIDQLGEEYKQAKFYQLAKKYYISGMIIAFSMAVDLLTNLAHKYDNQRGTLN